VLIFIASNIFIGLVLVNNNSNFLTIQCSAISSVICLHRAGTPDASSY